MDVGSDAFVPDVAQPRRTFPSYVCVPPARDRLFSTSGPQALPSFAVIRSSWFNCHTNPQPTVWLFPSRANTGTISMPACGSFVEDEAEEIGARDGLTELMWCPLQNILFIFVPALHTHTDGAKRGVD